MVYKRPFHDEESCEVGYKHPRHPEHITQQSPIVGIVTSTDCLREQFSDEGESSARKSEGEGKIAQETLGENLNEANRELQINASGHISSYMWGGGYDINDYADSEPAVHLSFFPHYFELDHPVTALVQPRDMYSVLLDHPPRKQVSVGPDHQADVPDWTLNYFSESSGQLDKSDALVGHAQSSDSCAAYGDDDKYWTKLVGTCVIPMPDMHSSERSCCMDGETRHYCNCLDRGSICCVKKHIEEAREKLFENLGQKAFEELGFCDMGEVVANKWTEEEEQMFHEVVLSNAASMDKNFWDHLSAVFPSRTRKDLVSYYFNVFMLRKRADQNRFDPLNIDSDNDEWQISEPGMTEQDDDSVVESTDPVASAHSQENDGEGLEGTGKQGEACTCKDDADFTDHRYATVEEDEGNMNNVLAAHVGNFVGNLDPVFQLSGKISSHDGEDDDIHDDSCA